MLDTRCCPVFAPLDTLGHTSIAKFHLKIRCSNMLVCNMHYSFLCEQSTPRSIESDSTSKDSPVAFAKKAAWLIFWSGSLQPRRGSCCSCSSCTQVPSPPQCCLPPLPQHVPFYYGTAVSPHCATRTPEDAPRQLDGEGGGTTCPPDHLGPPVGALAELLRATSVGRHPPTGHQLPQRRRAEPRSEQGYNKSQHFSTTISVRSNFATAKRLL